MSLTVVIPTLNEETDLPRCLNSLKFADEVIVVDCGSTDKTVQIAKKFGAKVFFNKFSDFSTQRNFADLHATSDWILSIDADIEIPPITAQEISKVINESKYAAFKIGRENIIWGQTIWHTDWSPQDDCHIRLYKKNTGKWESSVHEQYKTTQKIGKLKNHLIHHNYQTVSEFIDKLNKYSTIEAQNRFQSGVTYDFVKMIIESKKDFLKRFIYKLGFLDGDRGLFLSILQAIFYLIVNIKLYQLQERS